MKNTGFCYHWREPEHIIFFVLNLAATRYHMSLTNYIVCIYKALLLKYQGEKHYQVHTQDVLVLLRKKLQNDEENSRLAN